MTSKLCIPLNLQIRLIKNKNYCNKCIRKASRTSKLILFNKYWRKVLE